MSYTTGTVDDAAALTTEGLMALGYNENLRVKKMTKYGQDALQQDTFKSERVCVCASMRMHTTMIAHMLVQANQHTHTPMQFPRLYSVLDSVFQV
jgi:hypothetical protein